MIRKYVIDSFAWIEYVIGSEMGEFVNQVLSAKHIEIFTPSMVIAELSFKFQNETLGDWDLFFRFIKSKTAIVSLDSLTAEKGGVQKFLLRSKVPDIGLADAIIYQTALNLDAVLISGDAHFKDVPNVIYLKDPIQINTELDFLNTLK